MTDEKLQIIGPVQNREPLPELAHRIDWLLPDVRTVRVLAVGRLTRNRTTLMADAGQFDQAADIAVQGRARGRQVTITRSRALGILQLDSREPSS